MRFFLFLLLSLLCSAPALAQPEPDFTLVWADACCTWARRGLSDPSQIADQPAQMIAIAPDGDQAALVFAGAPDDTLAVAPLHAGSSHTPIPGAFSGHVLQMAWLSDGQLLLTTAEDSSFGLQPREDLWILGADGVLYERLPPGEGGLISVAPLGDWLTLSQAGEYGVSEGSIRLFGPDLEQAIAEISFPAVSTGSTYPFYPAVNWLENGVARVGLPDPDLLYGDADALTGFWLIGEGFEPYVMAEHQVSFFGQPRWSNDGMWVVYLRRREQEGNQFELIMAAADGLGRAVTDAGEAGTLGVPQWLPHRPAWVYEKERPGQYGLGEVGVAPRLLPIPDIFSPRFLPGDRVVYATAPEGAYELRWATLDGQSGSVLAAIDGPPPTFDVLP